ncbi:hypothetical protein MLD38_004984 [Melastoma candidum]|uniref:Uncharacterized protein n=1 Tax=Melastoma candidum TaxID=119954 RepID=A0ACB9S9C6_9MYRT|nr:hypothetical protein MLD38_004984 [Melastoma candidum]
MVVMHMLVLILLSGADFVVPQSTPAGTNFSCSASLPASCDTFVAYFAQPPLSMNVGNISDLFGVSHLSISQASNLPSEDSRLIPRQLLLVPVSCACNGTRYFANITYEIKKGDSYYLVSIDVFENLTNWHVVEDANPTLDPLALQAGNKVIFPLFCKCPSTEQKAYGINYLISYVWQPDNQVSTVANTFGVTAADLVSENGMSNLTAVIYHPLLIPVTQLPVLAQNLSPSDGRGNSKHDWVLVTAISVSCSSVVLAMLLGLIVLFVRRKPHTRPSLGRNDSALETTDLMQMKGYAGFEEFDQKTNTDKLLPGVSGYLGKLIEYNFKVVSDATLDFSDLCLVGRSVYKANIDGQLMAVKRFKDDSSEELKILQRVNHANLVKLMGICYDLQGNCILLYEYAENGSLDKWLCCQHKTTSSNSSSSGVVLLTWSQRLRVALDVAHGLQYMHEHAQPSIVHGDIRTSNILLDKNFKAKISNFAMAQSASDTVFLKVDVFAFGVMILELLSGKKVMEAKEDGKIHMLWQEIGEILNDQVNRDVRLRSWMDSRMEGIYPIEGAANLAALAKACTQERSTARPTMTEIVFNLSVLVHAFSDMGEGSWTSGQEPEDAVQIISSIAAR